MSYKIEPLYVASSCVECDCGSGLRHKWVDRKYRTYCDDCIALIDFCWREVIVLEDLQKPINLYAEIDAETKKPKNRMKKIRIHINRNIHFYLPNFVWVPIMIYYIITN
jgi:hypothetical protein